MFDPNHNAHANYYLVRGDLTGSWKGLDNDIIVVPWLEDELVIVAVLELIWRD